MARPRRIYRALTDPDKLVVWLAPPGMTAELQNYDLREGGGYSVTLRYQTPAPGRKGKSSPDSDVADVRFVKLMPDREIVQVAMFRSNDPAFAGAMTMTWTLTSANDATEVAISAEDVPEGITEADHLEGLNASLDNLARFVTE